MHVMSIAGSDPSSGAGIQGDLKTYDAFGVYGLSVITAITSQNTSRFYEVEPVSPTLIKSQIRSILEDFNVDAIKIGMVYDKQTVNVIYSELIKIKIPIILDPIFQSTTGGTLQLESAFLDFRNLLIPLSLVITPNIFEAEKISGLKIKSLRDMKNAAIRIQKIGVKNVIIKGGHFLKGDKVIDLLLEDERFQVYSHERIKMENHGGGCTFSAALCANIARGKKLTDSVDSARNFTLQSIRNAVKIGGGFPIIIPKEYDRIENQLSCAITEFCSIKTIYQYIPECQTNFVYSASNPKSLKDVVGLEGRIVKTGKSVTVAGKLTYGGSEHVASAVFEIIKKFPSIKSCVNLKYNDKTIKRAALRGLKISSYDRIKEPQKVKKIEGSTVSWGVREAISKLKTPPDIVYHRGDFGKEAMILIFGKTPTEVLRKIFKII